MQEGEVVLRLDETQTKANLAVFTKSLDELNARQARLEAEKSGAQNVDFPEDLIEREPTDPQVARILSGERKLFSLRLEACNGQKGQLKERITQLKEQISGISEQIEAKGQEIALIEEELRGVLILWEKSSSSLIASSHSNVMLRDLVAKGGS